MTDNGFYVAIPSDQILMAEDMEEGSKASCIICRNEHGRDVVAYSAAEALTHLETEHAWYWEVRSWPRD